MAVEGVSAATAIPADEAKSPIDGSEAWHSAAHDKLHETVSDRSATETASASALPQAEPAMTATAE